jgi:transcriptional regulator with XRE-family HTH domain
MLLTIDTFRRHAHLGTRVRFMGRRDPTVSEVQNPPVRRRELGALLRALRTDAELTVEQVAERLMCSAAKVSRMETGQRGVSARDIRDLCQVYAVTDQEQYEHLMSLARQGRGQAWWQPFNLPYADYVGLEAEATSISDYESGVFPGLFQVPDYVRAVHEGTLPRLSPDLIDQRVQERLNRQKILTQPDRPLVTAIVDEAVLHRAIGGPAVMAAQLQRVIDLGASLPNVAIRVLPFSSGAHPGLDSTFVILELAPPVPPVVYVEGLAGRMYLDHIQDVVRYRQIFERLCSISLSSDASMDLLKRTKVRFEAQLLI